MSPGEFRAELGTAEPVDWQASAVDATATGAAFVVAYLALRLALHYAVQARLGVPRAPAWLVPIRECLCFAVWAASLAGHRVRWRGRAYLIAADGRLAVQQAPPAEAPASGLAARGGLR